MIPTIRYFGKDKIKYSKNMSESPNFLGGGMNRWSRENFQGSEMIPYDTIKVDTWHHASDKSFVENQYYQEKK